MGKTIPDLQSGIRSSRDRALLFQQQPLDPVTLPHGMVLPSGSKCFNFAHPAVIALLEELFPLFSDGPLLSMKTNKTSSWLRLLAFSAANVSTTYSWNY